MNSEKAKVKTKLSSVVLAFLIAPLATIPITFLWALIQLPFADGRSVSVESVLLVAVIGTILFAYPATVVIGLSIYLLCRLSRIPASWQLFVVTAVVLTGIAANTELFERLFGVLYLGSAAACSWLFWRMVTTTGEQSA